MTIHVVHALVALEYEFVAIDSSLADLLGRLEAMRLPETARAVRKVEKVRLTLQGILADLDGPITDAVRLHERMTPAPF